MSIGVVMDIKTSNLEKTKTSLLNSIGKIPVGEDLFYLYNPESINMIEKKGEKIKEIYNYKRFRFNPYLALVETSMILGNEIEEEYRRKVIFITDKYDEMYNEQIDVMFQINDSQRFDCKYYFIEINDQNLNFEKCEKITVSTPEEIEDKLDEIFLNEEE